MLKENSKVFVHPIFGEIRLNEKFEKVLKIDFFQELAYKSQLGTKILETRYLNNKHSRLLHSVGVMYLTSFLFDICEKKFAAYFEITEREREIFELAALGHDIGHLPFSHSLEDGTVESHEERTIRYFEENTELINKIFGYDIVSEVVAIYRKNIDIKKRERETNIYDKLNISYIFSSLLIGSVDCDRMEYLMTDTFLLTGKIVDFRKILESITIVLLNGQPVIGFEKKAVQTIEEMLFLRFNNYSYYYSLEGVLLELSLQKYKMLRGWKEKEIEVLSEFDILCELRHVLRDPNKKQTYQYRISDILLKGDRKNIYYRKFEDANEYHHFLNRLRKITKRKDIIQTNHRKITLYNPDKNKIYIKEEDGVSNDFIDVSYKIKSVLEINLYYVIVDVDDIYEVIEEEKMNIIALFEDNAIEVEKKYIETKTVDFEDESDDYQNYVKDVYDGISKIPGVSIKETQYWSVIENRDIYYNPVNCKLNQVAIRYRENQKEKAWYIKVPVEDGTCITKRQEYRYPSCKNVSEFLELATEVFKNMGVDINEKLEIQESIRISTKRYKTTAKINDSVVEIVCDFSIYEYKGNIKNGIMLEIELKKGDDISLWHIGRYLEKFGFVETNDSKKKRAEVAFGLK